MNQVCSSVGHLDYAAKRFTGNAFTEVDYGHNFYAPQSFLAPDGRRLFFGWFSPFEDLAPEAADGWNGQLTIPREFSLRDGHLCNQPAAEVTYLRQSPEIDQTVTLGEGVTLNLADPQHSELVLHFDQPATHFTWELADDQGSLLTLTYANHELVLTRRGPDGKRYAQLAADLSDLRIILDTSSVEIFANQGWASFTERYYAEGPVQLKLNGDASQPVAVTAFPLSC